MSGELFPFETSFQKVLQSFTTLDHFGTIRLDRSWGRNFLYIDVDPKFAYHFAHVTQAKEYDYRTHHQSSTRRRGKQAPISAF